jgi:hypothetical protein
MSSTSLGAEEAVKHVLNIVGMFFSGVPASLEVVAEDRRACAAHHAQLLAQIRQVLCVR